jgi:DNA polymerase (family 10)
MNKKEIVKILNEISVLYDLKDESFFKIRAYQMAARALEVSDLDLSRDTTLEELKSIKGIGASIAEQIRTLTVKEHLEIYDDLKAATPPGLLEMLKIPGLGPKRIKYLYDNLGVTSISELEYACMENKLLNLPNFGEKTQKNILKGIELLSKYKERFIYAEVIDEAESLLQKISNFTHVNRSSLGGSIRRKKETVKDIDIVVSTDKPEKVMEYFTKLTGASEIVAKGDTKSTIRLKSGINADIRAVNDIQFPYALHHFTGSKEHNTAMRSNAKKMGIKMNEYGLFKGEELIPCKSEEDIFSFFGLKYIEPEMRENTGEIEAARSNSLPELVTNKDIKGLFHFHTTNSDGLMTLEQVVLELKKMGMQYGGIADHSKSAYYAGGISDERISDYLEEIDIINKKYPGFKIFKGIESDILPDGNLDYKDEILERFDFVIIAIHSNFNMDEKKMTKRIIKAMQNKYTTMLAHPTGRLLLARDPYNVNITEIIDAAADLQVALEINASPFRLDLDWQHCKYAKEKGVMLFINPDAHSLEGLYEYRFGVNTARKGWLEKKDVGNTLTLEQMEEYLNKKKQ